jgi:hypothetical protein
MRRKAINGLCFLIASLLIAALVSSAMAASLGQAVAMPGQGRYATAVWSPANGGLALGGERGHGLYCADVSGNMNTVSESAVAGWGFNWSPDGRHLAYRAQDDAGNVAMMVTDDSGKPKQLTPYMDGKFQSVWSKDGLTYKAGDEMVTVDAKGKVKSMRSLSQGRGLLTRIMVVTANLMAARVTGATLTALSSLSAGGSPSGTKLGNQVFVDSESKAWVVDENGNLRKLIDVDGVTGYAAPVASSQEGEYAVAGFDGNLYIADSGGSQPVNLGEGGSPTWSPDGRYVIYSRSSNDGSRLTASEFWIASRDGSWKFQLTNDGTIKQSPSWSPDGKHLAYIVDGVVYMAPIDL